MNRRLILPLVAGGALIAIIGFRSMMGSHDHVEPEPAASASAAGSASAPVVATAPSASSSAVAAADENDGGSTATAGGDTTATATATAETDGGRTGTPLGLVGGSADGGPRVGSGEGGTVTIDETKANTTVSLGKGQKLVVQLKANPSTGFDWSVVKAPAALGKPEMGSVPGVGEGAPGLRRLTFTLKDPLPEGEHQVELGYARSFEEGKPPLKTFRFKVRAGS